MAIKELFYDQRPVALLNPRASQRIDPRFKFTRDSIGTYIDQYGLLQIAAPGEPRFSYNASTGEYLGMIVEPGKTNLVAYSEQIDTWTFRNYNNSQLAQATANDPTYLAPDGTQTVDKIDFNGVAALARGQRGVIAPNTWYVASAWAYSTNSNYNIQVSYGIDNTRVGSLGLVKLPTTGGKLQRVSARFKTPDTAGLNTFEFLFTKGGTSGGGFAYVWGAQLEEGYDLTSYIPTAAATVTRPADLLSIVGGLPASGSVYVDAQSVEAVANSTLLSLKNASNQKINLAMEERSELYNSLALTYSIKGTVKPTLPYPVPTTNRERNIITWGTQNYQYNTDGARFAPSLSTTPGIPANLTQLSIGHDAVDPTKAFNGYINAVYLYNGEITPTVAEALVRGELDPINADTYSPVGPTGSLALIINTQGTSSTGDKVFALPAESALNDNDIVITWGDGTESGLDGAAAELGAPGLEHTYPSAGIYPVWVEGQLENLQFNNSASAPDLVKIEKWGTTTGGNDVFLSPSTMNSAFYGCSQLQSMPTSGLPDTSAVTDWYRAFSGCSSLTGTFPSFDFSGATSFQEAWQSCSGLTSFTAAGDQTQNVTNFSNAWNSCSGLTSFPLINTAAGTNFSSAWLNCTGLTSFPAINTASATNLSLTWFGCSSLTSFPLINTSSVTNFGYSWYGCASLTSFPLINTSSATSIEHAWRNCTGLTSFPLINTSSVTLIRSAWSNCSSLTSFPLINTSSATNFSATWADCSSLTAFPLIDTSSGTDFSFTWGTCSSLTSFPLLDTSSGTNFSYAWATCSGLTAFPALDMSNATGLASDASNTYTGFRSAWQNCTSLADFPANRFNTTTCTRFLEAFRNCALTAQSIENILVSIEAAGTSNGNLGLHDGTNAAKTTWSTAANTAYDALVARGWTITFNA